MALSTTSIPNTVSALLTEARAIKVAAQSAISGMANNVSANAVLGLCQRLNVSKVNVLVPALNSAAVMTELARALGVDSTAAVQSVVDAITNSISWVVSNFPTNGGYILKDTLNADGSVTVRVFTPVQTAGLRTQLQTIVDAIS